MTHTTDTNQPKLVGALLQRLKQQANSPLAFRWDMPFTDARRLLAAAYGHTVRATGHGATADDSLVELVNQVALHMTSTECGHPAGLMLCGTPGTGKTTMLRAMQMLTNSLQDFALFSDERVRADLHRIIIVTAKDIAHAPDADIAKWRHVGCLAIDDLGAEPAEVMTYGNVVTPLTDLIEYRYAQHKTTLFTTNLTAEQLRDKYGTRITDRLNEMVKIIIVSRSESYR